MADKQADGILQQYPYARAYLEQTLEKEAEEKIVNNRRLLSAVEKKILEYNSAVSAINNCLQEMQLHDYLLPVIGQSNVEIVNITTSDNTFVELNGVIKTGKLYFLIRTLRR